MAIFSNNLDSLIDYLQFEEYIKSSQERINRTLRQNTIRLSATTGAIISGATISMTQDRPSAMLFALASSLLINSAFSLYNLHQKHKLSYKIDIDNLSDIDYKALKKSQLARSKYEGKRIKEAPHNFYCEDSEDIEEEFGYNSDNDLPIQFLEKAKVPKRILREYELFSLKYKVPELTIGELEISIFVDLLTEFLKKRNLAHRIYFYTSNYFKRILVKAMINYEDTLSIEELITELPIFQVEEFDLTDIEELQENLRETLASAQDKMKIDQPQKTLHTK